MFKRGLVFLVVGLFSSLSYANCTVGPAIGDLGSESAWVLSQQGTSDMIPGGLTCSNIDTGGSAYLQIKVTNTANSFQLIDGKGHKVLYKLLADSATSGELALNADYRILTGGVPGSTFTAPGNAVRLWTATQITSGLGALSQGEYTDTVTLMVYYSIPLADGVSYAESPGFNRGAGGAAFSWGTGVPVTLNLSLNVLPACHISGITEINFGSKPLIHSFTDQNTSVLVSCSDQTNYTLGLDDGLHSTAGQRRLMSSAGDFIAYEVYKSDATRWGSLGTERWDSHGMTLTGALNNQRLHQASASMLSDQITPQPGLYNDVLVLEVEITPETP